MIVFCSCSFRGLVDKETLAIVAGKVAASGKEYVVVDDLCRIAAKEKEKRKRRLLSEIYFLSVHIR